jgi:hypothetical protein
VESIATAAGPPLEAEKLVAAVKALGACVSGMLDGAEGGDAAGAPSESIAACRVKCAAVTTLVAEF